MLRLKHLQILYGDAGAQEVFQNLVSALVANLSNNAAGIRVQRGDGGVDTYVGNWAARGQVHVYQMKYFPSGLSPSRKNQIRESFQTARRNPRFQLARWTLCLPADLTQDETSWFSRWATSGDRRGTVEVPPWGETHIEGLLSRESMRGIRERFLQDELPAQVREIHQAVLGGGFTPINRVLVEGVPGFRSFKSRSGAGIVRDLSLIPLVFEELLAHGATRIVVRSQSFEGQVVSLGSGSFQGLIEALDYSAALAEADDLFLPVLAELGLDVKAGASSYPVPKHLPGEVFELVLALLHALAEALFAVDNELQFEFNPVRSRLQAASLRSYCRQSASVAVLALLEGYFARYRYLPIVSLSPHEDATIDLDRLLINDEYRELAATSKLLGAPHRLDFAIGRVAKVATQIARHSPQTFDVRANRVGVVPELTKLPGSSLNQRLTAAYQPPSIPVSALFKAAVRLHKHRKPEPVFARQLDDDVLELGDFLLHPRSKG